jgi:pyrroline-5-carboxylate reductase
MKKQAKKPTRKLGLVGGGNMAEALIGGMLSRKLFKPGDLIVSEPDAARRRRLGRLFKVATTVDNREVAEQAPAIVIAVKPQTIDPVMAELAEALNMSELSKASRSGSAFRGGRLFISIAAGITIARLERSLGPRARVIRTMPNGPAMVGFGMTAIVRGARATRADETFALAIFKAVGDAVALREEHLLDAVTALSGSGPAYVYLFAAALADSAVAEGLSPELALRMTLQTLKGAEVSLRQLKLPPSELIRRVASPGGTTEAALGRFDAAGFSGIVMDALRAAAERSRELGR